MLDNIQNRATALGKYGCYFFSILKISTYCGSGHPDAFAMFERAIENKWCDEDAFMLEPAKLMNTLTGAKWEVIKAGPKHPLALDYHLLPGELAILRFQWHEAHFVVGDMNNNVTYDPWENSLTVKNGFLESKRIFRRI